MDRLQESEVAVVKIIECPRDAWQALPAIIPAEVKAAYLEQLADAGFRHIDAVSFVSPSAVPQMADSEEVLRLFRPPADMEVIGIVANARGAERAIATGKVRTLGFPYSISAQFLERNQRQTPEEALRVLGAICNLAGAAGLDVVAYISMAFGNPYGEAWSPEAVTGACRRLSDAGIKTISLADTVGVADADAIAGTLAAVLGGLGGLGDVEAGIHLHARRADAADRIRAAYQAGCRRFDSAIGGLGGCPFAQDELVGNIPTEVLLDALKELGAELPEIAPLDRLMEANAAIARGPRVTQ